MNRFTSLKLFLMTLVILLCFSLSAKQVGQNAAVTVARSLLNQKFDISQVKENQLTLAYTETIANPKSLRSFDCYYVFNVGKDQGFIIISGDDIARPILGYSTQGTFDVNNLPPNFEVWMNNIAEAISQGAQKRIPTDARIAGEWNAYLTGNTDYFSQKDDTRAVASLITTVWNQGDPFNLFCPVYNGTICITGCVATAMAQLMNYYQHPAMGIGSSPEYLTETNGIRVPSVSFNVAYDWDNMIDNYNYGVGTQAQKEAVATLMYHCGVSVYMDYSPTSSGAYYSKVVPALINYFDYDKGIRQEHKSYYSDHEWIVLLKQQIDANKPIYYTGNNIEGGGHAFICDGYDGNHFHFNWGWGGYQDGYYSVDPMPDILFPLYNMIFTDIKPDAGGQYVYQIGLRDEIDLTSTANSVSPLETFTATAAFYNRGFIDFPANGQYGIGLFDTGNNLIAVLDSLTINQVLKSGYYWEDPFSFNCQIPATIPAGDYTIRAITKATELNGWEIARGASIDVLPLTVIVNPYTVTFDAGNGICTTPSLEEVSGGSGVTLPIASPSNNCIAVGYEFAGWATTSITETTTAPTLYAAGTLYYPTEDCTLYAVYMKILDEIEIASVGFENSEGFQAGTTYNNTAPNNQGATGKQWAFIMGTPSTTGALDDLQSAQMRSYENNPNKGSVTMLYDCERFTKLTFNAKYSNGSGSLNVYLSSNSGNTWNMVDAQALTTAKESYTCVINDSDIAETMRIKFENPTINVAGRVYVDNVKFYRENTTYNSNPDCTVIPVLTVSEENLDFEAITVGQTSEPQTVTVSGTDLTGAITYVKGGADAAAFTITETSWNPETGGALSVTFEPTEARAYSATLTISSEGAEDKTVTLSGTGVPDFIWGDSFEYAAGTLLSENGWDVHSDGGSNPNPITISSGALTYLNYAPSGVGNKITMATSGEDVNHAFPSDVTSGILYAAFMVNLTSAKSAGDYFAHFMGQSTSTFSGRVFAKSSETGYQLGITKSGAASAAVYASQVLNFGTTYLVVMKYEIVSGTTNDLVSLYLNPVVGNAEPATASATASDVTGNDPAKIAGFALRQGTASSAPELAFDGVRVARTWEEAVKYQVSIVPTLTVDPIALNFNGITTGTTSEPQTITVSGTNLTGIITYSIDGTDAAAFTIDATSFDAEIGGTLGVAFKPTEAKTYNATITISSEGAEDKTVTLSGTGIAPATPTLTVEPISLTFTDVTTGTISEPQTITVSGTDLTGNIAYVKGGADAAAFTITETSWNPETGGTLGVTFAPTEARTYNATITITSEGAEDKTVTLSGTGIAPATPTLTVEPISLTFTDVTTGTTSEPQTITVSGTDLTGAITYVKGGADAAAFTIDASSFEAAIGGTLSVTFAPTEARTYNATITINSEGAEDKTVTLNGTGIAPATPTLTVEPISLTFTDVTTGTTSEPQTVTVSGTDLTGNITYIKGGADAAAFTIDAASFDETTGGALSVTFAPTEARAYNATITISSEGAEDKTVTLSGTGILAVPVATVATDITTSGFTANWNEVQIAEEYELNVYTKATNLLSNPGFETGTTDGWAFESGMNQVASTAQVHSGEYSLYASVAATKKIRQIIDVTSGATYNLSFWYYLDPSTTGTGFRVWTTTGATIQLPSATTYFNTKGSWQKVETTFVPTANSVTFELRLYTGCTIYLDDFEIKANDVNPVAGAPFTTMGTSFAVTNLDSETTYYYTVKAKAGSQTSDLSNEISVTTLPIFVGEQILLTWDAFANATKKVELSATAGEEFLIDWGDGTTNTYTGTGDYWIYSHAYTSAGLYSVSANTKTTNGHFLALNCNVMALTALDVSEAKELTALSCYVNDLTALDVTQNIALTALACNFNQITALDVTQNRALTFLNCSGNKLTALNVSQNTVLNNLYCNNNQLATLDITSNTALTDLDCSGNQLIALNVSQNTALTKLNCSGNQLSALDVSQNRVLNNLYCNNNNLKFSTLPSPLPAYSWYTYAPQDTIDGGIVAGFVDLSSEYSIQENITVYRWYEVNGDMETEIPSANYTDHGNGTFTFGAAFDGKILRCKMTNVTFPYFTASAPLVYEVTIEAPVQYIITATAGENGTIDPKGEITVTEGDNQTFTFTPSACYQIDQVLINGVNNAEAVTNGIYTFTNVTEDQTMAVSFKLISYTITATAGEGGTIMPSGTVLVDCGSDKAFTFTPSACYQIDQVLINGLNNAEAVANGIYTFTNVTEDQTIAVSFKRISYTITATADANGTITPSGTVLVDCGSDKTFTFTPSACHQIDQVLINGVNNAEAVTNGTYTFTNVTEDQTIAVSFKLISYTITATADANGTIAPSGTVSVDCGSDKTFTFTPSACHQIDQVLINGVNNAEAVTNGTYTFTNVTEDQTIEVSFKRISYTITATADANGTITPSGTVSVDCGSDKTFTFTPSACHQIDQVLINGVNNAEAVTNGTYTFTNVTDDQTIAVSFKRISYTITATADANGTITPSGTVSVDCGSDKTFTFTPSACHQIDQVLINGVNNAEAVTNGTYTFTNVTDDQTIAVSFKRISYTITATADANGTITPSGTVLVDCGSDKTFTFTPSACHQIDQVLINGVNNAEAVTNGTYTFTNVTDDQTIAVSFKRISYTITATADANGMIAPSGTVLVDCGSDKTFTFTPSACHQIDQVLINGVNNAEAVSNGTYTFTNVTDDQTIAVSFKRISYTITATADANGTITPSGTVSVDCGSDKTFTFTPSACHQIDQVLINGVNNAEAVTNGTYTFTNVTDDQTIAVSFKLISYTITATAGEGGTIMPSGTVSVDCGSDKTFTFTPSACHQIDQVLINGVNNAEAVTNGTYTFTNVTDDKTIAVSFKRISYTITATAGEGGTIMPSGTVLVDCGSDKAFTFTPSACYQIDQVLINGLNNAEAVANGIYTFTNVTEDQTIAVSFKRISYTITATADANGTITPSGTVLVDCGSDKTFTFTPSACHQIDQVLINGVNNAEAVANGNYTFTNVTDDQTIAVSFKLISYTITATAGEGGTIMPSGTVSVDCGSDKTFTFTPSACYQIDQVLINGVNNAEAVTNGTYTFTNVTEDQTIAVSFKLISYTITATADANGMIAPSGTVLVDCGSDKTFTFTPSACHQIDQVLINGVNNAEAVANGTYTFTNVTDDQTIAVSFKRISYTITATADANGTITPSGTVSVDCGSDKTFTFTPSACHQIDQVLINGVNNAEAVSNGTYTFTNVTDDQTIAVSFKRISYTITATADANGTITPSGTVSVDCGSDKTFTFTPSACHQIDQVLINGVNNAEAVTNGTYTFTNVTEDQIIEVSFKRISYTITATADANGTITPSGTVLVDCGDGQRFTFTADNGYEVDQLLIDEVNVPDSIAGGSYTFVDVTEDHSIEVTFKPIPPTTYTITATAGENGTIDPEGEITVTEGDHQTFTFTANNGYEVYQLLVDEVNVPDSIAGGSYTFVDVMEDHSIEVTFKLIPPTTYTISASAGENGSIDPEGEITVTEGDNQTFTFTADNGYEVDELLIDEVNVSDSIAGGSYTFENVTEDHTIEVTFKPIPPATYTITATAGENGSIDPEGEITVIEGDHQTFTFTADNGYEVDQLLIDEVNVSDSIAGGSYTFENVTEDHTIEVTFKPIPPATYIITATAGENGSIDPEGERTVIEGDNQTFTFIADNGYEVDQLLIDEVNVSDSIAGGSYTFVDVMEDHTIEVTFKPIPPATYIITASAGENGSIDPEGEITVIEGDHQTFTFTANNGYEVDELLIDEVNVSDSIAGRSYTFENVTEDHTIEVTFKSIPPATYTISATAGENGTIDPEGEITVTEGDHQTFTFTANNGYEVDQLLIDEVNVSDSMAGGSYTFVGVTEDHSIEVTFKPIPPVTYIITATAGENGSIDPEGEITVTEGDNQTFTFIVNNGYEVDELLIDEVNVSDSIAGGSYTFENVTEDHTIEVTFKSIPPATYTISATAGENGTIDPEGEITVTEGDHQTFTFTANNGYEVDQLLIDEVNVSDSMAGGSYTFVGVTEDHTIEVTFKPIPPVTYIITATAGENGSIDPEGEITVTEGDNQTFTFIANNGYEVDELLIDEVNVSDSIAGGSYTFENVTEDHTIEVTFKSIPPTTYTITATAGENGNIDPEGEITVTEGDNKTFTFIANNGYEVDQLLIDEVNVPDSIAGGSYTFVEVTEDHSIEVTFKSIPPTTYTISASAGENGNIDPEGEITVTEGDHQTFTFTANNGYEVDQLLIDEVNVPDSIAGGSYTFVEVTEDHSIEVTFKSIPPATYTISASAGENGSIDPEGEITVTEGDNQTFTFTANNGYEVDELLIDEVNVPDSIAGGSYTFVDVTEDHTIEVTFKSIPPDTDIITATAGENGTIDPEGEITVIEGDHQTFTFTANNGYEVYQLLIDEVNVPDSIAGGSYTFVDVTEDHTIEVTFKPIPPATYTITATAGANGTISPNGNILVNVGDNQNFTFTANNGYEVDQLLVDDVNVPDSIAGGSYTFVDVTEDHSIEVTFKSISLTTYTISASAGENGSIDPEGEITVTEGDNQTFTFTANNGYEVDQLLIDEVNVPDSIAGGSYTFVDVMEDHSIEVTFKPIPVTQYTITATAGENGTIDPEGEITVTEGDNQTFTFIADNGYEVHQLLIDEVNVPDSIAGGSYTFVDVMEDHTIEVTFKPIPPATYIITATAGENGSIDPEGEITVIEGDHQTFTFTADNGYEVHQLLIDEVNVPDSIAGGSYTFVDVMEDHTIEVTFKPIPPATYIITATAGENGSIDPEGDVVVAEGNSQRFTFTANNGYEVYQLLIDEVNVPDSIAGGSYTFVDVTEDHTIEVTFKPIPPATYTISASAGENGSIDPEGEITVIEGDNQTFTFTADNGYEVDQLLVDEVNVPDSIAGGSYTFVDVTEDHTIEVTFKSISPTTYTISASAGENGSIDPEGEITVIEGDNQTFTFIADNGYEVDELLVDNVNIADSIAGGSYTFENVTEDHSIEVIFKAVPVSNIELSGCPENGLLANGATCQLQAVIFPDNALNSTLIWRSTNPNTAIVDATGKVTARSTGVTYIIAKVQEGDAADTCHIRVVQPVSGIVLTPAQATLLLGEEKQLMAKILPENATIRDIIWSSSDETAVTVDAHGKITGIAAGEGVITAKTVDGDFEATCTVVVVQAYTQATGVTVTPTTLAIGRGETYQLSAEVKPANASQMVTWSSNNPAVATVAADGTVTALAAGKATITAKTDNNYKATCAVTVTIPIDSIVVTPDEWTLPLKGAKALKATVYPADASNKTITWSSSNTTIATVSSTGTVTAKNINGVVEIYATNTASGKKGICVITVGTGIPAAPIMDISEENTTNHIVLYPNPTVGKLKIESGELRMNAIKVFDITGRLVLEMNRVDDNEVILDLSGYAAGVYFINVDGKTMKVVKK